MTRDRAGRELTMSEALNEALHEEMERDDGVFVIGEDIAQMGGLFQVTAGLLDRFGPQRVIDAPISEAAQAGAGVGAALVGCRPVVELQIADFVTLTMDQVVNHAAKWRYMSGGRVTVPFVLRGAVSSGIGMAAQHSQTLEAWFVHAPGLVVVMPSTPVRREGPAQVGDPRRQPGRLPREATPLQPERAGAGRRVHGADRRRRREAGRHRRHRRRVRAGRAPGAPGGAADGARGGRGRGRRRAHAEAARPGDDRRVGAEDRPARGRHRGALAREASPARSSPASSTSASMRSRRRRCA